MGCPLLLYCKLYTQGTTFSIQACIHIILLLFIQLFTSITFFYHMEYPSHERWPILCLRQEVWDGYTMYSHKLFSATNPTTHQSQQRMLNTAQSLHHVMEDPHWTGKEEIVDRWPNLH